MNKRQRKKLYKAKLSRYALMRFAKDLLDWSINDAKEETPAEIMAKGAKEAARHVVQPFGWGQWPIPIEPPTPNEGDIVIDGNLTVHPDGSTSHTETRRYVYTNPPPPIQDLQ
jgi:hypothetical protein